MKKIILFLFLFAGLVFSPSLRLYAQCPPEGNEPADSRLGKLNKAKNRSALPPHGHNPIEIPLTGILGSIDEPDSVRYHNGAYVVTVGYITSYEEKGPESCNCDEGNKTDRTGDVHIYIGLSPDGPKSECMIVEITPAYKLLHPGYASELEEGKRVTIMGYMLYDFEHKGNAANTCTSCKKVWRKTCWEIHPVTDLEK